jgi:hypothetical protein
LVCKRLILYQLDIDLLGASVIAGVVDATRIGQGAEVNWETSSWFHHDWAEAPMFEAGFHSTHPTSQARALAYGQEPDQHW